MFENLEEVYYWLAQETGDKFYYVRLLKRANYKTDVMIRFASLLKSQPEMIKALIQARDWRNVIVGIVVNILLQMKEYENFFISKVVNWHWIAPQFAAGIALLSQRKSIPEFEKLLDDATEDSDPKTILSAYAALKLLESPKAEKFEKQPLFDVLKSKDDDYCIDLARGFYDNWKDVSAV